MVIIGDEVLKIVSRRILDIIRTSDLACRIGGDEFLIILNRVEDLEGVNNVCSRLISRISESTEIDGITIPISVSIGISISPENGISALDLKTHADEALYDVKKTGKNNFQFYYNH